MRTFIVWYNFEGEEDYMFIDSYNIDEAGLQFSLKYGLTVTEIHEVDLTDNTNLVYA